MEAAILPLHQAGQGGRQGSRVGGRAYLSLGSNITDRPKYSDGAYLIEGESESVRVGRHQLRRGGARDWSLSRAGRSSGGQHSDDRDSCCSETARPLDIYLFSA